jgi:hypothetical protein
MASNGNTNNLVQARDVVDVGIALLQKELTLVNLFFRDSHIDWTGRPNDTVNIRIPQRLSAARQFGAGWRPGQDVGPSGTPTGDDATYDSFGPTAYGDRPSIVVDTVGEVTSPLTIDKAWYKALGVTLEDLTLTVPNFARQYLAPQVRTIAEELDGLAADTLTGANYHTDLVFDGGALAGDGSDEDAAKVIKTILLMRNALNAKYVPQANRKLVVGINIETALLLSDKFQRYDSQGNTNALRDATIGRIFGMDVVVDQNVDANAMYLFHNTAFIVSTVTPRAPEGAVQAASASGDGVSVMWLQDYDALHMIDRSVVTMYAGASAVADGPVVGGNRTVVRAAKASFTEAGSV